MSERKRAVRTIIIEGDSDWVDRSIEKSIVPGEGYVLRTIHGFVKCISLSSIELSEEENEKHIKEREEDQEKNNA